MRVLIACEESQAVCKAFRERGHEAYSCDIIECSGGHPEWHIQSDVLEILNPHQISNAFYGVVFKTQNGEAHAIKGKWDLIIAHPPCTYLTVAGNRWFNEEKYGDEAKKRKLDREEAVKFFMEFANADCEKIAIENPVGVMSTYYRKPNQTVHPYMFGDKARKATCFWLKGLPLLQPTDIVEPIIITYKNGRGTDSPWHLNSISLPPAERRKIRSKTFPGMAKAMAEQWG